jgi:hypothetical protein
MSMTMTIGIDNRESDHDVDVIIHDWSTWAPKGQHAYRVTTALDCHGIDD